MTTILTTNLKAVKLNGLHRHRQPRLILETEDGSFHTASSFRDAWRLYVIQRGEIEIRLNDSHIATDARFTCPIVAAQRRHARNHVLDVNMEGRYIVSYENADSELAFSPQFNSKDAAITWMKNNI